MAAARPFLLTSSASASIHELFGDVGSSRMERWHRDLVNSTKGLTVTELSSVPNIQFKRWNWLTMGRHFYATTMLVQAIIKQWPSAETGGDGPPERQLERLEKVKAWLQFGDSAFQLAQFYLERQCVLRVQQDVLSKSALAVLGRTGWRIVAAKRWVAPFIGLSHSSAGHSQGDSRSQKRQ